MDDYLILTNPQFPPHIQATAGRRGINGIHFFEFYQVPSFKYNHN